MKLVMKDVVVVTSANPPVLQKFLEVLTEGPDNCSEIGEKGLFPIDYIDESFAHTTLNIDEYLNFFGLANGIFSDEYMRDMEQYYEEHELWEYTSVPIKDLNEEMQYIVRLFISIKKDVETIVINNIMGQLEENWFGIINILRNFCSKHKKTCIIVTRNGQEMADYVGEIYHI